MAEWNVSSAMDFDSRILGFLTTDAQGIVIKWTPVDPAAKHAFDAEMGIETISVMSSHLRTLKFTPRKAAGEISHVDDATGAYVAHGLEPARVIQVIADRTGESLKSVHRFLESAHHVTDLIVTDDVTILAYPLLIARPGCPVWERVKTLVKDQTWTPPDSWDAGPDEIAAALRLPAHMLERYPVVGDAGILSAIFDDMGLHGEGEERRCASLYEAWIDTYEKKAGGVRSYRVTPVGREDLFEDWLIENVPKLSDAGLPVRLVTLEEDGIRGKQPQLAKDSRADLLCRFTRDEGRYRKGDWLVVENKTTAVGSAVADQLSRYVDWLSQRGVTGTVHGLLIADGTSVDLGRALRERDHVYLSLSQLGYRDVVRAHPLRRRVQTPEANAIPYPTSRIFDEPEQR